MLPKRRFWKTEQTFGNVFSNSRRQLTPVFDKPAFSRFSQNCEPRFVVEIFGKIVKRQVCQNGGELPTAALNGIDLDVIASSNVYSDTRITCLKYHFESLLYALA